MKHRYRYCLQTPNLNENHDIDHWLEQPAVYDTDTKLSVSWKDLILPENRSHFLSIKNMVDKMDYTPDQIGYYDKRFYQSVLEVIENSCQ